MTETLRVTIAVPTYHRAGSLSELLPRLVSQAGREAARRHLIRVLVIDNAPDEEVRAAVEESARSSWADGTLISYAHEPEPGISAARNRALVETSEDDLLIFIDDDERPTEHWLASLVAAWQESKATAVVGPVVSTFAREPDGWIRSGGFFTRRRLPTGTAIDVAATNNLLLDVQQVRRLGLRFDLDFGITGGEDIMFTRTMRARGGSMVWCDEAIVLDVVPHGRATRRWVLLRALSSGNSWGLTSMKLAATPRDRLIAGMTLHLQGTARIAGGALRVMMGFIGLQQSHRARGARSVMRGVGMVLGAWGSRYHEYRRPS